MSPADTQEKPPRDYHLGVRLSPEERARLLALAREHGCSISEIARACLLSVPLDPRRLPPANRIAVEQLARIGNNLNQLVKLLHQGRAPAGLKGTLTHLIAAVDTLREELHLSAREIAGRR